MKPLSEDNIEEPQVEQNDQIHTANNCMLLGAGVGVLGAGSALIAGTVCPLCVVVSPALLGLGFARRIQLKLKKTKRSSPDDCPP